MKKQRWITNDGYSAGIGDTVYSWLDARPATIYSHKPDEDGDSVFVNKNINNGQNHIYVRNYYYLESNARLAGILYLKEHCKSLEKQIKRHKKTIKFISQKRLQALKKES
jgi:hypothetical protein